MDVNDENNPATVKLRGFRGSGMEAGRKFVADRDRRALRDIRNFMGAHPFPSAVAKRGLSDKSSIDDTNPHFGGRRPMTRQFSASLANKQHQDPNHGNEELANMKETKAIPNSNTMDPNHRNEVLVNMKETKAIPNSNTMENFAFIDVDEYMEANDPLPSYVMQTEAILEEMEENCKIDEVQMVDLEVEPVLDIDSYDKNNPLAVVDYVEDIYAFYRKSESTSCVCPNYMYHQTDINEKMRAILIDWLIEVHYKFELMHETLFLTVNLIDRFLERQAVARRKLQLVGVTAMLLACKYEEVTVPVVEDLILISDKAYSKDEVLEMEKLMINTLQFNLSVPTPYVFMRRFLKAAESDKKLELLSFFIIELCLVEYEMVRFHPSMLAAAAIYTAQCTVNRFKYWSKTSERHTNYTENQLIECAQLMVGFHQKSAVGKLTGIHRKYCTSKFGFAAKSEPALFLLDKQL